MPRPRAGPSNRGHPGDTEEQAMSPKKNSRPKTRGRRATKALEFPIVCVGASAGGLEAFIRLLETLPPDIGMAFIIIQHLDPTHVSVLPPLLAKKSTLPVVEAS